MHRPASPALPAAKPSSTGLPARLAREAAGFTARDAARRLRVTPAYLLACERSADWPFVLADRAARLYRCDLRVFLRTSGGSTTGGAERRAGGWRASRPREKTSGR